MYSRPTGRALFMDTRLPAMRCLLWFVLTLFGVVQVSAFHAVKKKVNDAAISHKEHILRLHNGHRSSAGAADMKQLVWSDSLAEEAFNVALSCNYFGAKSKYGVNKYYEESSRGTDDVMVTKAIDAWSSERMAWEREPSCMEACQYTQIVWAKTKQIGCAFNKCNSLVMMEEFAVDSWFLVCFYNESGNDNRHLPFKTGKPCTKCSPSEHCHQNLCSDMTTEVHSINSNADTSQPNGSPATKISDADFWNRVHQKAYTDMMNDLRKRNKTKTHEARVQASDQQQQQQHTGNNQFRDFFRPLTAPTTAGYQQPADTTSPPANNVPQQYQYHANYNTAIDPYYDSNAQQHYQPNTGYIGPNSQPVVQPSGSYASYDTSNVPQTSQVNTGYTGQLYQSRTFKNYDNSKVQPIQQANTGHSRQQTNMYPSYSGSDTQQQVQPTSIVDQSARTGSFNTLQDTAVSQDLPVNEGGYVHQTLSQVPIYGTENKTWHAFSNNGYIQPNTSNGLVPKPVQLINDGYVQQPPQTNNNSSVQQHDQPTNVPQNRQQANNGFIPQDTRTFNNYKDIQQSSNNYGFVVRPRALPNDNRFVSPTDQPNTNGYVQNPQPPQPINNGFVRQPPPSQPIINGLVQQPSQAANTGFVQPAYQPDRNGFDVQTFQPNKAGPSQTQNQPMHYGLSPEASRSESLGMTPYSNQQQDNGHIPQNIKPTTNEFVHRPIHVSVEAISEHESKKHHDESNPHNVQPTMSAVTMVADAGLNPSGSEPGVGDISFMVPGPTAITRFDANVFSSKSSGSSTFSRTFSHNRQNHNRNNPKSNSNSDSHVRKFRHSGTRKENNMNKFRSDGSLISGNDIVSIPQTGQPTNNVNNNNNTMYNSPQSLPVDSNINRVRVKELRTQHNSLDTNVKPQENISTSSTRRQPTNQRQSSNQNNNIVLRRFENDNGGQNRIVITHISENAQYSFGSDTGNGKFVFQGLPEINNDGRPSQVKPSTSNDAIPNQDHTAITTTQKRSDTGNGKFVFQGIQPAIPESANPSCVDNDPYCEGWGIYCTDNVHVFENCKKTCGTCSVPLPPETTTMSSFRQGILSGQSKSQIGSESKSGARVQPTTSPSAHRLASLWIDFPTDPKKQQGTTMQSPSNTIAGHGNSQSSQNQAEQWNSNSYVNWNNEASHWGSPTQPPQAIIQHPSPQQQTTEHLQPIDQQRSQQQPVNRNQPQQQAIHQQLSLKQSPHQQQTPINQHLPQHEERIQKPTQQGPRKQHETNQPHPQLQPRNQQSSNTQDRNKQRHQQQNPRNQQRSNPQKGHQQRPQQKPEQRSNQPQQQNRLKHQEQREPLLNEPQPQDIPNQGSGGHQREPTATPRWATGSTKQSNNLENSKQTRPLGNTRGLVKDIITNHAPWDHSGNTNNGKAFVPGRTTHKPIPTTDGWVAMESKSLQINTIQHSQASPSNAETASQTRVHTSADAAVADPVLGHQATMPSPLHSSPPDPYYGVCDDSDPLCYTWTSFCGHNEYVDLNCHYTCGRCSVLF